MEIDHIGIAVRKLEPALAVYGAIGIRATMTEAVPSEGVRVAFLPVGESHIELLEPLAADGPIAKFLENRGEGLHHIALAVDDIQAAMTRARSGGLAVIDEVPRQGARGRKVAFVHPKSTGGVLLEFVQNAPR
ncbi:MAG: methylmalonyl-CoA epimerase [Methanobacteriota archaeon]|nr:MAG: methylmalonyl-CoA epimerase [Euryarchaeota archaeon]